MKGLDQSKCSIEEIYEKAKATQKVQELLESFHEELTEELDLKNCKSQTVKFGITYYCRSFAKGNAFLNVDVRQKWLTIKFFTGINQVAGRRTTNLWEGGDNIGKHRIEDSDSLRDAVLSAMQSYEIVENDFHPHIIFDSININLKFLDLAVEKTIRPFLVDQRKLENPDSEGYHHQKILANVKPLLTRQSLELDTRQSLENALKQHVNLLSQFEFLPAAKFIEKTDEDLLKDNFIDLLYGDAKLEERLTEFLQWSEVQEDESGKKSGFNATVVSYLLAESQPDVYPFCKPTVYKAAAEALLSKGECRTDPVERLVHAKVFYKAALKLFRERYDLPFFDLLHVHIAFYIMEDTYHGLPGWKDLINGEPIMPKSSEDLNVILYGPPGTGKTYDTFSRAVEICDGIEIHDREELVRRYAQLRDENRIGFVTFHQSYGYEEFVEGIRPELQSEESQQEGAGNSNVRYTCRDGIFKQICAFAQSITPKKQERIEFDPETTTVWKMSLGDTQDPEDADIYDECIEKNFLLLGYGGNLNYSDCENHEAIFEKLKAINSSIKTTDYAVRSVNILKNMMSAGDLVLISDGNHKFRAIARITGEYQFLHRESYNHMRPVEWLVEFEKSLPYEVISNKKFTQRTVYRISERNLKIDAIKEMLSPFSAGAKNYVLIIDEINRGNVSKILGELITLIEPDKRLGAENELQVTLPYSGDRFGVPSNVYLIGTMNTADRSIAILDVALRRRFRFIEMMPDIDLVRHKVGDNGVVDSVDIAGILNTINARIELLYDRDHQIGHSYFLGVESLLSLKDVFCWKVIPLLQEYFYGDWKKVCMVLGCPIDEDTGKNDKLNSHPVIFSKLLKTEVLLPGGDDLIEDDIRCTINPSFESASSSDELSAFFHGIVNATQS